MAEHELDLVKGLAYEVINGRLSLEEVSESIKHLLIPYAQAFQLGHLNPSSVLLSELGRNFLGKDGDLVHTE